MTNLDEDVGEGCRLVFCGRAVDLCGAFSIFQGSVKTFCPINETSIKALRLMARVRIVDDTGKPQNKY